jgi:MFS family permease
MSTHRSPPLSSGWVVVAVSATVNMLAWSMRSTFALFYVALLAEFGWRRGDAALGYSLSWLLLLLFSPLCGRLADRWGAGRVVAAGGLILGAALVLTARVTTLWQYFLTLGVLGAAGVGAIQTPAATAVSRRFVRSRGAAMGIVSAGASASAILFYPLNAWLIVTFGWRVALVVFGAIVAVVTIPLGGFFYRDRPVPRTKGAAATAADANAHDWTLAEALRSRAFWAVFAMWALGVIGYQIVTTHQVAHAVERGFDPITLGWVYGFGGVCTVIGNLFGGWLSDRWGREIVFTLGSVIGVAGIAALGALDGPRDLPLLVLYAVSGIGFGMRIALLTAIPADIFAGRSLGVILGAAHGGGGLGGFIGPFLGGWLFDVTGSYRTAFVVAALSIAAAAAATWIAAPRRSRAIRSDTLNG